MKLEILLFIILALAIGGMSGATLATFPRENHVNTNGGGGGW